MAPPSSLWIAGALVLLVTTVFVGMMLARRRRAGAYASAARPSAASEATTTLAPGAATAPPSAAAPPPETQFLRITYEEDEDVEPTKLSVDVNPRAPLSPPTKRIVYDEDAANDEPTKTSPLILLTATGQTDTGRKRKRNEDSVLMLDEHSLFVVADGMGGYNGGEVASKLAVNTIESAFRSQQFTGNPHALLPERASELARAIQMANDAILDEASKDASLEGMGTTVCALRFLTRKPRLYIGHVGDSRAYRLRDGRFTQLTSDHTMADLGVKGEAAAHLSRAVGVWPTVPVDIVCACPRANDVYLICSDGLSKMVPDEETAEMLGQPGDPQACVRALIARANDCGGKDNVSVVIIRVDDPSAQQMTG